MDLPTIMSALGGFAFAAGSAGEFWSTSRRSPVGAGSLVGKAGRVVPPEIDGQDPRWVIVEGERWQAVARTPLTPGSSVRIEEVQGLQLVVSESAAPSSRLVRATKPRWQWAPGLALWGIAIISAFFGGGSIPGALLAGPLAVLFCLGAVVGLGGDAA